ncbi:hypothetical protein ACWCW7_25515 [Nocardia tengchongensis]
MTEFLRRRVWTATLGEVERAFDSGSIPATFIKPADRRKSFTGAVCYSERDIAAFGNITRRQRVWCSEVVDWVAESGSMSPINESSPSTTTTATQPSPST